MLHGLWQRAGISRTPNASMVHPDETPTFSIAVPGLRPDYCNKEFGMEHREMQFTREDLRRIFDRQLEKLFNLIDKQLSSLSQRMPHETVGHLVLSGGLGQSAYVQKKLRDRYSEGSYIYPNAQTMQVRLAPDPQLAVCKGLVADRLRKLKAGEGVLGWRCCRASYGLICKKLYDKNNPKHIWRRTEKDPRDGKLYVQDCVDWFVEKVRCNSLACMRAALMQCVGHTCFHRPAKSS